MKKPDRFERLANKIANEYLNTYVNGITLENDIKRLLRREHAWMRRMVRQEQRELEALVAKQREHAIAECLRSRVVQCEDILTKLEQRRK